MSKWQGEAKHLVHAVCRQHALRLYSCEDRTPGLVVSGKVRSPAWKHDTGCSDPVSFCRVSNDALHLFSCGSGFDLSRLVVLLLNCQVRINTGKNTTLKFSEKKEEARRKRKSGGGHAAHELPMIKTPADIYR